jgi:hypothetical protein
MYLFNGARVMLFEVELDCQFSEPQYSVKVVYINGSETPLSPEERRNFVEQNRTVLEYLCGTSHRQWLEEVKGNETRTLH